MKSVVEQLKHLGLTEYEAKVYLALLNMHLSTATQASKMSEVPRTRIYSTLESLNDKGWIKIYSGVPLLFKAVEPPKVLERVREDLDHFLESIQTMLKEEVSDMKEKFVIKKYDIGLEGLKREIGKAKTVEINNATTDFVKKVSNIFRKDAVVKILLFPGEEKPLNMKDIVFREAEVAIVSTVRSKDVPSMSITLDEGRTFTVFQDPVDERARPIPVVLASLV